MPTRPPNARAKQSAAASKRYEQERARGKIAALFNTTRWRKRSAAHRREEPICRMCAKEGLVTPCDVADHITPHRGDQHAFWHGDLQSLCHHHHAATKQALERRGPP